MTDVMWEPSDVVPVALIKEYEEVRIAVSDLIVMVLDNRCTHKIIL